MSSCSVSAQPIAESTSTFIHTLRDGVILLTKRQGVATTVESCFPRVKAFVCDCWWKIKVMHAAFERSESVDANNHVNEAKSESATKKLGRGWITRRSRWTGTSIPTPGHHQDGARFLRKVDIVMIHPLRTLLCELFVSPPLRLLQRAFGRNRGVITHSRRTANEAAETYNLTDEHEMKRGVSCVPIWKG